MLLYRGDVDRIRVEGPGSPERGANQGTMRLLRKVLAGSRYQIVNYRSLGYELILADTSDPSATAPVRPPEREQS